MCGTAIPMKTAASSSRQSFKTLTHATPRIPLVSTNPATMENAMNPSEARHFNNDAEPGELKLQIRDDEDHSHQGYESRKIFAAVPHLKEIGLSLQTVFLSKL